MEKNALRPLIAAKSLTLERLLANNPALANEVVALVHRAEQATLNETLADVPEEVRAKVAAIDLTVDTGDLVEHLRVKLIELGVEDEHVKKIINHAQDVKLGQGLDPKQPIGTHPVVAQAIAIAHVHEVSALAGLPESAAVEITKVAPAPSALDDATLTRLVSENKLTDAQAKDVGFSATLYELVGQDAALATAILAASFPRLNGRRATSTEDLVKLSAADWAAFFASSKVALPDGTTPKILSSALAGRFGAIHPGAALTGRLPKVDVDHFAGNVTDLGLLLKKNPKVIGVDFAELDTKGLRTAQITKLRKIHDELTQLAGAYPGLELASVLDDPKLTAKAKAETVARRTGLVQKVNEQLGETLVLKLDLSSFGADVPGLGLDKIGATAEEQRMVVSMFQTYQRVWAVSKNIDDTHTLVAKGYSGSLSIAKHSLFDFQKQTGFDAARSKSIQSAALDMTANVGMTMASIVDQINGIQPRVSNQSPSAAEYLKRLAGYEELFGSLSFCNCEECRSILGPAAYFVDLMKYIEEHLLHQFAGLPRNPLDLRIRRPDLWTLELSCDNTNVRVPTLDLVDEILENYIATWSKTEVSLTDRTRVGTLVYQQTLYEGINTGNAASFRQPFHLPLARIGAYLYELGHTRAEVAEAVAAPELARVKAELGLSAREHALVITNSGVTLARLSHLYGLTFVPGSGGTVWVPAVEPPHPPGPPDATRLGRAMGVTHEDLGQLLATSFVKAGRADVRIVPTRRDPTGSVQNDVELVEGLTADALDRLHRFTRLARKTSWSIQDLDLVLATLHDTTLTNLTAVATLHAVQARLGVTVAELCALAGAMPQSPTGHSLLDRLFNPPPFNTPDRAFPKPAARFIHPVFRRSTPAPPDPDQALPRLLRGLSVDLGGLEILVRNLARHLAQEGVPSDRVDPTAPNGRLNPDAPDDNARYFVLSADNLTLLYRHARLARLLRVSIADLFQLLQLLGHESLAGITELLALLNLHAWQKESGYSLDDLVVATGQPPRDAARYPDAAKVAAEVKESAATALTFTDTVFALALGKTEHESRDLLAHNSGIVERPSDRTWRLRATVDLATVPVVIPRLATTDDVRGALRRVVLPFTDQELAIALGTIEPVARDLLANNPGVVERRPDEKWRLKAGINLDTVAIAIPPTATVPASESEAQRAAAIEVRDALRPYVASEVLARGLGAALGLAADKVVALAALGGHSLTANAVIEAMRGDGPLGDLTALVSRLRPLTVAFAAPVWDAPAIDFVRLHREPFGLPHGAAGTPNPNVPFVNLAQLRALSTYARLGKGPRDDAPEVAKARQEDLRRVLSAFDPAVPGFPSIVDAAMARVLGVPSGLVAGLRGRVTLPAIAAPALDQLDTAAQLATALGVDGQSLGALVSDDYEALSHAGDALVTAMAARHADEAMRAAKLEEAEQPVREARRDALADYLIHSVKDSRRQQIWSTLDELYEYFLIDVEAGGCSTTSRVVAATMSVQLYVYRAIMNLEKNRSGDFALQLASEAAAEWVWRKNYRVWQANRKVFLWPENYLEPDLRDDKTPLFKELEQELLQTDINDQNVADAYTKYLAGLEEVASLTVAGAYHDRRGDADVLHLFGVTAGDPPVYYWRSCENLIASAHDPVNQAAIWSPWQKITVQITGRKVSPVVHLGRLHVFWIEIKTQPLNQITGGTSKFVGYRHTMSLKFTSLRPDKTWTAPQEIQLPADGVFGPSPGQVEDPLVDQYLTRLTVLDQAVVDRRHELDAAKAAQQAVHIEMAGAAAIAIVTGVAGLPGLRDPIAHEVSAQQAMVTKQRELGSAEEAAQKPMRARLDMKGRIQTEAIDGYTLSGPNWEWGWVRSVESDPPELAIQFRDFRAYAEIDLFGRTATTRELPRSPESLPQFLCVMRRDGDSTALHNATPTAPARWPNPGFANAVIDTERMRAYRLEDPAFEPNLRLARPLDPIATIPAGVELLALALPGSEQDGLFQIGSDIVLLQGSATTNGTYVLRRLGTTVADDMARCLFENNLDVLLSTESQLHRFRELGLPMAPLRAIEDRSIIGRLDFAGPYGVYYRELFVHIPFLIANALNSRGRFEAAQRWYHYIFDPTAAPEEIDTTGMSDADAEHRLFDRVWRYSQFRGQDVEHVRAVLTDADTIALYKKDPFNPWAIARSRTSAFQKAIVMKYVDNLLDWADSLFTQFTTESVNEALMLYIMASDVLGSRPAKLGDCGTGVTPGNTYQNIGRQFDRKNKVIGEVESLIVSTRLSKAPSKNAGATSSKFKIADTMLFRAAEDHPMVESAAAREGMFSGPGGNEMTTLSWGPALSNATTRTIDPLGGRSFGHSTSLGFGARYGMYAWSIVRQMTPAFCVPPNSDLLSYWDRIEDRLYKIRHCMDIDGNKHELALFSPPIDPMDLVAMRAAGLSLQDVLGTGNGNLPPYRFLYLIERAKAFAANLSGFGSALVSALEKKDAEHLNRVRLTQQMNMTQLTTQVRQLEIDAAAESREAIDRQREAARYRSEFYAGLISENRNGWEIAESIARHTAGSIHVTESVIQFVGAIVALVPNAGAPTAMTYGGTQLNQGMKGFGYALDALAKSAEAIAASSSLEANFARRIEGWTNQRVLADFDIKSLDRQMAAANIRLDIANRSLKLHEKSIEQLEEFLDLTDGKFTNLGLYTWMSTQLQTLYRGAYQNAMGLAKLAERAYRFERGEDNLPRLRPSYWDPTHAGLLAGEGLLMGLQTLERRFLETNYRTPELDQAFALSQVDPQALVNLRETGECTFEVGEVFFDLFYPGHYKRRIKAVRLTIPSITGPYVNVSATLNLTASRIRPTAAVGAPLVEVPPSRSVSIATSTAQNDAGVFELSFRDERYMPFEGLGAISAWRLTLPKSFHQFDYQTINDVILSISYTAEHDGVLRERVEAQNADLEGSIVKHFSLNPAQRLFSLRQDFSSAFTRLLRSPVGSPGVTIELSERNFPMFFRGRDLHVAPGRAKILLRTASGAAPEGFRITIDGASPRTGFVRDTSLGNLPGAELPDAFFSGRNIRFGPHTLVITAFSPGGDSSAIDAAELLDVLLYLEYQPA